MNADQIHMLAVKAPYTHIKVTDASAAIDAAVKKRHHDIFSAFKADLESAQRRLDILSALLARISDWSQFRENENDLCKWIFRGQFMQEIDAVLAEHVWPYAAVNQQSNSPVSKTPH